ncbi:MAG: hypothetical protein IT290_11945 [Deltaproteobacteria bacterium]|nr:hypothetical protein [Deltaproteobacteria bacterium]
MVKHDQGGSRIDVLKGYDPSQLTQASQLLGFSAVVPGVRRSRFPLHDAEELRNWSDNEPVELLCRALTGLFRVLSEVEREVLLAAMHTNYEAKRGVSRLKRRLRKDHDITPDRFNEILKSAFRRLAKAQQRRRQN